MGEIFKPINGYEGHYEISNYGEIKSLRRYRKGKGKGVVLVKERFLKPFISKQGYVIVQLYKKNDSKKFSVHRLVMLVFKGKCPEGYEVNHKDGNKENNNFDNLEYVTHSENMLHAFNSGLKISPMGNNHYASKLTKFQVIEIRKLHNEGETQREISKKFPVGFKAISKIVNRQRWKHI